MKQNFESPGLYVEKGRTHILKHISWQCKLMPQEGIKNPAIGQLLHATSQDASIEQWLRCKGRKLQSQVAI